MTGFIIIQKKLLLLREFLEFLELQKNNTVIPMNLYID